MATDLEKALFAMAKQLKQQTVNTKLFLDFMEELTNANKSIGFTHEKLIPIIQDMSNYLTDLPTLMNDIIAMNEEVKLFMMNIKDTIDEIGTKFDKIIERL